MVELRFKEVLLILELVFEVFDFFGELFFSERGIPGNFLVVFPEALCLFG
jgi:hypothetical protein